MIHFLVAFLLIATKYFLADNTDATTESMFLRLYNKDSSFLDVDIQDAAKLLPLLTKNEELVIYIHGYKETVDFEGPKTVSQAYLAHTNHNMLAVDYREIADLSYPKSVALLDDIGKAIAGALNTIVFSKVNVTKVHLIGHSFGSHVAGSAARQADFKVSRVTGLDPAGALFYFTNNRLTSKDAEFVDIMHTDLGMYGLSDATGHVDFYPNYGHRPQPGCSFFGPNMSKRELCSHHRSYLFYAESIRYNNYVGVKCVSHLNIKFMMITEDCNERNVAVMGYRTPKNTRGHYFMITGAESPYGKGVDGIKSLIS